jgi:hypothetical protein
MQLGAGVTRCSFTARPSGSFPFLIATTLGLPCRFIAAAVLLSISAVGIALQACINAAYHRFSNASLLHISHPGGHRVAPCSIARPSFRWQDREFIVRASSNGTAGDSADGNRKEEQSNDVWENLKVVPLRYASSLHNVNKQYLRYRRRRKWWGRMQFPKVGLHVKSNPWSESSTRCLRQCSWGDHWAVQQGDQGELAAGCGSACIHRHLPFST